MAHLNVEQQSAVETLDGPVLVIAGAGSGKTRVVTYRIARLLQHGVLPSQILGLTFTNKAANEMKERVRNLTQSDVLICTFHSLGARILRESIHHLGYPPTFTIYDEDDAEKLLKVCLTELYGQEPIAKDIKQIKDNISYIKNQMQTGELADSRFSRIYHAYQDKLRECQAVDYDDLLALPVKLFQEFPDVLKYYHDRWSHVLIDEYQDTNQLQYQLINYLVSRSCNICVVGDPDQSIYSWRGANIRNILNFEKDYPGAKVVNLSENYRSHANILDAANALISNNTLRYEKQLKTNLGPGPKIKIYRADTDRMEADFVTKQILQHYDQGVPLKDMVVFYRTNAQSRVFEDRLLNRRIPYVIIGGLSFYQRREIKDILAWLRIIFSDADFVSFSRTINLPKRGLGSAALDKIGLGAVSAGLPLLKYCLNIIEDTSLLKLNSKQRAGLEEYLRIVQYLRTLHGKVSVTDLVNAAIEKTGYATYLEEDKETLVDRRENLAALVSKAAEWEASVKEPTLVGFLEELSLKTSVDDMAEATDRVNLMTAHNGKGLEFEVVFLVGLEEGLFPHINSQDDPSAIEEERRLCYVGMTRAKKHLYLTHAVMRTIWGTTRTQRASKFLGEVPSQYVEKLGNYSSVPRTQFIDEEETQEQPEFLPGALVFHPQFGVGRVEKVFRGEAGLTYTIFFSKTNSQKNIVGAHAQLSRL